jgi:hypothetical protein
MVFVDSLGGNRILVRIRIDLDISSLNIIEEIRRNGLVDMGVGKICHFSLFLGIKDLDFLENFKRISFNGSGKSLLNSGRMDLLNDEFEVVSDHFFLVLDEFLLFLEFPNHFIMLFL